MPNTTIRLRGRSARAVERLGKFGDIKIRLDASVDETTRKIVRAYARGWHVVAGEAKAMSTFAAEMRHSGAGLTAREVADLDRVNRSLNAMEQQVRRLSRFTGVTVSGVTSDRVRHDVDTVLDVLADLSGIDRRFTKPSGAAIEGLVLRSAGRIEAATRRLDAYQSTALKDALLRGLVYGDNPRDTAGRIMTLTEGAFLGGGSRASTIARTEIMDANRYATRLAYNETEFVTGWKWLAQLDTRTCPACWAMHGTEHPKTEPQYGHANCRCTTIPVLLDDEPADHDLGDPEEIFWGLSREDQLAIMGPGRLQALEAGVRWSDLTYLKRNPDWRPAQQVTRVSDLAGLAELNVATFPGDVIEIPGMDNASIMSYAYQQGGLTVHALTGEQPTSGYVVARQGTSLVVDAREFFGPKGPAEFAAWMRRHGDRLDEPGAHVGMWYDTANGKVVLDVVEILDDRDAAIALGRAEDQIAIFDLGTFAEIQTGGTGGYASNLAADLGRADIGRTATITYESGTSYTGRVVAAGEWGIRIQTPDGEGWSGRPGMFVFHDGQKQTVLDDIRRVQEIQGDADHGIPVDYSGASPKSAQELDDSLDALVADWPGVAPSEVEVRTNANGAYATTHTTFPTKTPESWIEVDESNAGDYTGWQASMLTAEQRGHFHGGTHDEPAEYTIDHEFGHVLDWRLLGKPGSPYRHKVVLDALDAIAVQEGAGTLAEALGREPEPHEYGEFAKIAWENPAFERYITEDLSYYAATHPQEMIAEAFAVYRDHGPGTSVIADSVMRSLVNAYAEQFGVPPSQANIEELIS